MTFIRRYITDTDTYLKESIKIQINDDLEKNFFYKNDFDNSVDDFIEFLKNTPLVKRINGYEPFVFAINMSSKKLMDYFYQLQTQNGEKIDINKRTANGWTNLIHAVRNSNIEIVEYLISLGADIEGTDLYGNTPLICAASFGKSKILEYLINKGADVNKLNSSNEDALFYTTIHSQYKCFSILIAAGANYTHNHSKCLRNILEGYSWDQANFISVLKFTCKEDLNILKDLQKLPIKPYYPIVSYPYNEYCSIEDI